MVKCGETGTDRGKALLGANRKDVCVSHIQCVGSRLPRFPQSCRGLVLESNIRSNIDLGPKVLNSKRKKANHHRYKVESN